jgi:hypothetical protein
MSGKKIADIRGVDKDDVKIDVFGDLRRLRGSIIHHGGVIEASEYKRLKILSHLCAPDATISPTHDQMHKIFVAVKQAIGELILYYTGQLPGAPKPGEIVDVAIQNAKPPPPITPTHGTDPDQPRKSPPRAPPANRDGPAG